MEKYKEDFIELHLETGALKIGSDFVLKNNRVSPYFINLGDFNDSITTAKLGEFYAHTLENHSDNFDIIYGIPERGVAYAIAVSIGLGKLGINKPWFFTRKMPKEYGELTNTSEIKKANLVGRYPEKHHKIMLVDDVFTAGTTKYETKEQLDKLLNNPEYCALIIAVDRQEIGVDGKNAIEEFTQKTGILVISIINISEIYNYLKTKKDINQEHVNKIANYIQIYGTEAAKKEINLD